jgi:hypothetical protein
MAGIGKLLKQAQKMQEDMQRVHAALASRQVEGAAGGGAVKATARCDGTIVAVKIDPKVVDPGDVEMLEDLVLGAVVNALENARKVQTEEMAKITGGMSLPGIGM